jgi:hypothetical protein
MLPLIGSVSCLLPPWFRGFEYSADLLIIVAGWFGTNIDDDGDGHSYLCARVVWFSRCGADRWTDVPAILERYENLKIRKPFGSKINIKIRKLFGYQRYENLLIQKMQKRFGPLQIDRILNSGTQNPADATKSGAEAKECRQCRRRRSKNHIVTITKEPLLPIPLHCNLVRQRIKS